MIGKKMAGKGDKPRPVNYKEYSKGYSLIRWRSKDDNVQRTNKKIRKPKD